MSSPHLPKKSVPDWYAMHPEETDALKANSIGYAKKLKKDEVENSKGYLVREVIVQDADNSGCNFSHYALLVDTTRIDLKWVWDSKKSIVGVKCCHWKLEENQIAVAIIGSVFVGTTKYTPELASILGQYFIADFGSYQKVYWNCVAFGKLLLSVLVPSWNPIDSLLDKQLWTMLQIAPASMAAMLPSHAYKETISMIEAMAVVDEENAAFWTRRHIELRTAANFRSCISRYSTITMTAVVASGVLLVSDILLAPLRKDVPETSTMTKWMTLYTPRGKAKHPSPALARFITSSDTTSRGKRVPRRREWSGKVGTTITAAEPAIEKKCRALGVGTNSDDETLTQEEVDFLWWRVADGFQSDDSGSIDEGSLSWYGEEDSLNQEAKLGEVGVKNLNVDEDLLSDEAAPEVEVEDPEAKAEEDNVFWQEFSSLGWSGK